jgi:hypothetical protein
MVLISLKVPVNRFQPNRFGLQTEGFATELKSLGKFDSVSKRFENNFGTNEEPSYGYKFLRSLPRVFGIVWFRQRRKMNKGGRFKGRVPNIGHFAALRAVVAIKKESPQTIYFSRTLHREWRIDEPSVAERHALPRNFANAMFWSGL